MASHESTGHSVTVSDVLDEVVRVLTDARRYLEDAPDRIGEAMARADIDARMRYLEHVREGDAPDHDPELIAVHLATWLVEHADLPTPGLSLEAALAAASKRRSSDPLARDLLEFVRGYVAGEIDDEEFVRRERKPRGTGHPPPGFRPPPRPPGAIPVSAAETTLRAMLADAGLHDPPADPRAVWEVFKSFADKPVVGDLPSHVDSDDLLFHWHADGDDAGRLLVEATRQFTICDRDGDFDHLEQLTVAFTFESSPETAELEFGAVRAAESLEDWFADVEQSAGFSVLSRSRPVEAHIGQRVV
ncbi:MAG TPA: hypothetical protein VH572_12130 [Gaiella sp.]|jgi:hypothetical protein